MHTHISVGFRECRGSTHFFFFFFTPDAGDDTLSACRTSLLTQCRLLNLIVQHCTNTVYRAEYPVTRLEQKLEVVSLWYSTQKEHSALCAFPFLRYLLFFSFLAYRIRVPSSFIDPVYEVSVDTKGTKVDDHGQGREGKSRAPWRVGNWKRHLVLAIREANKSKLVV